MGQGVTQNEACLECGHVLWTLPRKGTAADKARRRILRKTRGFAFLAAWHGLCFIYSSSLIKQSRGE